MKKRKMSWHTQEAAQRKQTKSAKTSTAKNPPTKHEGIEEESEEKIVTHIGRVDSMIDHFTMANARSEEDD